MCEPLEALSETTLSVGPEEVDQDKTILYKLDVQDNVYRVGWTEDELLEISSCQMDICLNSSFWLRECWWRKWIRRRPLRWQQQSKQQQQQLDYGNFLHERPRRTSFGPTEGRSRDPLWQKMEIPKSKRPRQCRVPDTSSRWLKLTHLPFTHPSKRAPSYKKKTLTSASVCLSDMWHRRCCSNCR